MDSNTRIRHRAEEAGYRVGASIGRLLAPKKPSAPVAIHPAIHARSDSRPASINSRPAPANLAQAKPAALSILGPRVPLKRESARFSPSGAAVLGVGMELPFTRPLLRGLLGILGAEILLAGYGVVSLVTLGSLSDPVHVASAVFGLASPLLQVALQPLLGPILAELALALVGVGVVMFARSGRRSARRDATTRLVSALPAEPSFSPALPHRLIAAG